VRPPDIPRSCEPPRYSTAAAADLAQRLVVIDTDHGNFVRYGYARAAARLEKLRTALIAADEHAHRFGRELIQRASLFSGSLPRALTTGVAR